MKSKMILGVFFTVFLSMIMSTSYAADQGSDFVTKPFWNFDKTYRASYDIEHIVGETDTCSASTNFKVGVNSIFHEVQANDDNSEKLISFDYIKDSGGTTPTIHKLYRLCTVNTKKYLYRRSGGIDTGILVVPYKVRSGDLYGDSTLGPYVALRGDVFSLLATFGMTQVSVADVTTSNVKSETGLSYALGAVWTLQDSFEIGLVAGKDHLSGTAGRNFAFQDKWWWSFAIGYKFTKD